MAEEVPVKNRGLIARILLAVSILGLLSPGARGVEPEKQPIYINVVGGLLCGTTITTQCKVPAGRRLIIEYVSGFVFQPLSPRQTVSVAMAVTAPQLGINGASFHHFVATRTKTTSQRDVFVFSTPMKMMLGPQATFFFANAAGLGISGYLVNTN